MPSKEGSFHVHESKKCRRHDDLPWVLIKEEEAVNVEFPEPSFSTDYCTSVMEVIKAEGGRGFIT